jgi:hypothetical protein
MRRGNLAIILLIVFACLALSGCNSASQTNPASTPAPLPKLAADVIGEATTYGGTLLGQLGALSSVMDRYKDLLQNPRMGAKDWELLVNAQGAAIDLAYESISRINPPEPLKEIHGAAVSAVGDCLSARKIVQSAMLAADAAKLGEATKLAQSCVTKTGQVRIELQLIAKNNNLELSEIPLSGAAGLSEATPTAASPGVQATVNDAANLRGGPGTTYDKVGGLQKGAAVTVIGRNEAGDWLVVRAQGIPQAWIAAFLVSGVQDVPSLFVVRAPP